MTTQDTIAAQATAAGRGGIGVIRISGDQAVSIAHKITGQDLAPRHATYTAFLSQNGHAIDQGIAIYFPGPNSFTGEDVVELQAHGGPFLLDDLLKQCTDYGARIARPGEFSERAFLNDKIDLVQAEAIADLIDAGSRQAARLA
ncbi:MAG: tRNA uridine-5-carboxymethylaminomethyl(34) synthesis GTPase MnmE, partial [Gammaproteobacteria bacterium]|nr:tRNA uridine-5-carboxymethylaminomethyl(34) synthesis GTPase MnmE [Gammaproteobacteria bacterium]